MRVLDILQPPLVALDVGTSTTRAWFGSGGVVERPSVVGEDVHGSAVVRPAMRAGVVADIAGVAVVVRDLLGAARRPWSRRPGAVVCAPSDVSTTEREALIEAVAAGGASVVAVVPEPLAAAIGAGADVASAYASAVVDIGDGVTDFAVFRSATMVRSQARRVGCGSLREAVHEWLELRHGLPPLPGGTIDAIVRAWCGGGAVAGAVIPLPSGGRLTIERDVLEMLLEPVVESIAEFVAATVRGLPDALAVEVIESGIHVTGGGAKLERLVREIEARAGLPLTRVPDPLRAVIRGAGAMLRNRQLLRG